MRFLLLLSFTVTSLFAADTFQLPKTNPEQQIIANDGRYYPASVAYTTDGNGNVVPIGSSAVTIGTVIQGAAGASPWLSDLSTIFGAAPSATNYIPFRLTDGTAYVSPSTSGKQDTGNTSLSSIDGKLPASLGIKTAAASLPTLRPVSLQLKDGSNKF